MASLTGDGGEPIVSDLGDESKTTAAWSNKPLNGVVEESVSVPLMDVGLWPSLGDSTVKPAVKSSSTEIAGNSSNKPADAIVNDENTSATTVNNVASSGQTPTKQAGASSGAYVASNGMATLGSPPSPEPTHITSAKPVTLVVDSNPKDPTLKDSTRGNNQHYQRSSYTRGGNGGYHPRGGDYGGKVDQRRGNQDWKQNRNFQQHRGGYGRGGYVRPPVYNTPPVIPQMQMPMRPFANNLIYPDAGSPIFYYPAPAQPMVPGPLYFSFMDPVLNDKILNQINYYFSNDNLVKDLFLRRSMDEQGWVSVNLIAGFKKVSSMTDDVQLILHVMRSSGLVEVQGEKMRRRNDWMRWLLLPVGQDSLASSSRSSSSGELQQG